MNRGWRYHAMVPLGAIGLAIIMLGIAYHDVLVGLAGVLLVAFVCWEDPD